MNFSTSEGPPAGFAPRALPLLVYFGAMGLLGISLDAITGLVGCMALGVAADDTMHLMTRFAICAKEELAQYSRIGGTGAHQKARRPEAHVSETFEILVGGEKQHLVDELRRIGNATEGWRVRTEAARDQFDDVDQRGDAADRGLLLEPGL